MISPLVDSISPAAVIVPVVVSMLPAALIPPVAAVAPLRVPTSMPAPAVILSLLWMLPPAVISPFNVDAVPGTVPDADS